MSSFSEIIAKIGVPVLAEVFGVAPSHVRTMKARDSVPAEYWGSLIAEAEKHGVTDLDFATLRNLRAKRFSSSTSEAA